jgi:D-serine deaminase-like pyridoxal phosphate-dependent protein
MPLNRRAFLAASALGAGLATRTTTLAAALAAKPLSKADLPTPALLVDLDRLEANLKTMADHARKAGCHVRPHAKTHKCPEIARRQVAAGALGVSVATVPEAEAMVAAGLKGVLLTSPILEPVKIARMLELAQRGGDVMLAVGHPREADMLADAADAARVRVDVLVDLDVGDHRFGITPGAPALELARRMAKRSSLRVRGVQAYAGLASHVAGFEARRKVSLEAMGMAVETRDQLKRAGIDAGILSGGSTGTYNIDSGLPGGGVELQVGSYVFMDVGYCAIGGQDGKAVYGDFQPSLTVLTTVVNTTLADRVSVDAGVKSFATESPARPQARDWPGLSYKFFGDEFGLLTAEPGATLPKIGDRLEFYIPHCDPTVNLYDRLYAVRGDVVEDIFPIVARKEFPPLGARSANG